MSQSKNDELVNIKVVMTSNAAIKEVCSLAMLMIIISAIVPHFHYCCLQHHTKQQISVDISNTKLSELKDMLADDEYFGSKAPVGRQRIFYLGRELKSGGRSLCNLGLGKFNNRILHLYVRPVTDERDQTRDCDRQKGSTAGATRKRNHVASPSVQESRRQRHNADIPEWSISNSRPGNNDDHDITTSRTTASTSNHFVANTHSTAIDLVDSSDDDEVEIIEVL